MKRRTYLASTLGLTTLLVGCTDTDDTDDTGSDDGAGDDDATSTPEEQAGDEVDAAIGDLVEGENIHLVIEDVERGAEFDSFLEPDPGNEFLAIELAMKNVSDEALSVSQLLQSSVHDDEGYSYDQTFVGDADAQFNDGQFAPGEVERGQIAYEVPEDAEGLELRFDFDLSLFGGIERAYVDLESEGDDVSLEQDLQVDVHGIGDGVEFGDVEVTVEDIRFESELGMFAEAEAGHEYAIVDIAVDNQSGEDQQVSTILQMQAKDGDGRSFQEDWMATADLDQNFDEGTPIADGETRRGEVVYEVPENTSPLYWVFEFDVWVDGDKTFWEIA